MATANFLGISDEDMIDMTDDALDEALKNAEEEVNEIDNTEDEESNDGENNEEDSTSSPDAREATEEEEDTSTEQEDDEGESDPRSEDNDQEPDTESGKDESDQGEEDDTESSSNDSKESQEDSGSEEEIDYKDAYLEVMKEFKANGRMMKVNTPDEVRQLMQMGANYTKKMAAIKPNLQMLKTLENNDLLDQDKLNYLIDLNKHDPEAIKKLIEDAKIDPLTLDTEEESTYTPSNNTASQQEVDLDLVLDEISSTDSYTKTMDTITNQWDAKSRDVLVENPQVIAVINDHVATGIYDQIADEVNRQKVLGNISPLMSDLEAYKQVGDALHDSGKLNPTNTDQPASNQKFVAKKGGDKARIAKRKAAKPTKSRPTKKKKEFDVLSMSDEDFEKLDLNSLAI